MDIKCPTCKNVISTPQKYPYHSGFSNLGFLYCNNCPTIVLFGSYNSKYVKIIGNIHPWALNDNEKTIIEESLLSCPFCNIGRFLFSALPRCTICNETITNLLKDNIYFYEIGNVIDGDKTNIWK